MGKTLITQEDYRAEISKLLNRRLKVVEAKIELFYGEYSMSETASAEELKVMSDKFDYTISLFDDKIAFLMRECNLQTLYTN